ncbi:MAG: SH3 domain-containing protein [Pseudomonadota bacterium]
MFRLIVAALATLYVVLLVFGDESRRQEGVTRAEPLGLSVISATELPDADDTPRVLVTSISDREAIEQAMAAAKSLRAERALAGIKGPVTTATNQTKSQDKPVVAKAPLQLWYVTGSRVNLREGPSTSNAVIGQVTRGSEAEVLGDQNGWYQIRLANGSVSGWISGQFLNEKKPG